MPIGMFFFCVVFFFFISLDHFIPSLVLSEHLFRAFSQIYLLLPTLLCNHNRTHHPLSNSASTGTVTTSLAEDVFFLVDVQLNVLHDFLQDAGILNSDTGEDVIEDALLAIFRCVWAEQTRHRESFLTSFELCCATANDFFRMMTRMEELMTSLEHKYPFLEWH